MLPLPAPNRQPFLQIQPVNTLHVDRVASTLKQDMQPSIAVARLLPSQLHQRFAQFDVAVRSRLVSIARPDRDTHDAEIYAEIETSDCRTRKGGGKSGRWWG